MIRRMNAVGRRLPARVGDLPRRRRAPVSRRVPPPGPLRCHDHPARRTRVRRGPPGTCPATAVPLRPPKGLSGIQLHAPPRHDPDPDAQRVGAEADDEVLRGSESQRLLRRRGVQGHARKTGSSPLVSPLVRVRKLSPHTGDRELSRQPRWDASHGIAESEAGLDTPSRSGWSGQRRPSASARRRSGRSTS